MVEGKAKPLLPQVESMSSLPSEITDRLVAAARANHLDVFGGSLRRSSSRFCLGVEHGDYNGTELFGVGTDRFIWVAYKPNGTDRVRLFSENFSEDGLIDFALGHVPEPGSPEIRDSWCRFPMGVDYVLRSEGYPTSQGFDAVVYGDIPGGGMSRSASLCLNLILTFLEIHNIQNVPDMAIVDLAQAVENRYIGSPCGILDQVMILFAKEGQGTHYLPQTREIRYVPWGAGADAFRIVSLDTGTVRPGLEKSTYKIRRDECERMAALAARSFPVQQLGDIRDQSLYHEIVGQFQAEHPELVRRMKYIFEAQQRFAPMMAAWKGGDIKTVGEIFRQDGIGLRDDYRISGPELESMCDIARTVPGVYGERMLGGGDKGAAGALVATDSVTSLQAAVDLAYPRSHPDFAKSYAVHSCKVVDGIRVFQGL